ncbi:MAG: hypothetical protein LBU39_11960 [Desulfobulbaceae bacterium]|jgi:hypothetical protein|nr:hypothetical protein [Desulfobulbaceae bacterium]
MWTLSKSHKSRLAIRAFKTMTDAIILQGSYMPSSPTGERLTEALAQLSPEIYGSMGDARVSELKGLEYVIDRMPKGIEHCRRIVLTAQEDLRDTAFEEIMPLKRRRVSYRVSPDEMCCIITRGYSEIYDFLTHITFLHIEAEKIRDRVTLGDEYSPEWRELERLVAMGEEPQGEELDRALWNLSVLLGRAYGETRDSYLALAKTSGPGGANNSLFRIIHDIGRRLIDEREKRRERLRISFTPSLQEVIGHHRYGGIWATNIKNKLRELGLHERPLHIISANMHSVANILFAAGMLRQNGEKAPDDLYAMIRLMRSRDMSSLAFAAHYGLTFLEDVSGAGIEAQIIDTAFLSSQVTHPALAFNERFVHDEKPVILVMDYAFGEQAFEVLDELLSPGESGHEETEDACRVCPLRRVASISIMGKAGILPGKKGDVMLATAHVMEGMPHNYLVDNDLSAVDFGADVAVYRGPMVTVLGTSLQNRDVLERFATSSWRAVGLEMEGGHYQRAINAGVIRGHIARDVKIRYAYYASDNPLQSGQTLASGPMGEDGIVPTYLITRVILEKILNPAGGAP